MRPESFKSASRGEVLRTLEGYWAFHPEPLPRQLDVLLHAGPHALTLGDRLCSAPIDALWRAPEA